MFSEFKTLDDPLAYTATSKSVPAAVDIAI